MTVRPPVAEWRWIESFAAQFKVNGVTPGMECIVLSESASRPDLVETSLLALESLGAKPFEVVMRTPANPGPVAIRSTGTSLALNGLAGAIGSLSSVPFVVDCTVEGMLHAKELGPILSSGTSILMVSLEHPEVYERMRHDPVMAERVTAAHELMKRSKTMRATSEFGTDLTVELAGAFTAGSTGVISGPGSIAHWPGGLVLAFPAKGTVNGTVVLAPGDINLTFKHYITEPITMRIENDYVVEIKGNGYQAELMRSYLEAFDADAYATSHVGFGMNTGARWDFLELYDRSDINGTEARAFGGNFLFSTGANENADRFTAGHFDLPMRNHSVWLDDHQVVDKGTLVGVAAGEAN
ncbi:MAG: peptidase M29 [Candidatus Nanopelagicales bacterium]